MLNFDFRTFEWKKGDDGLSVVSGKYLPDGKPQTDLAVIREEGFLVGAAPTDDSSILSWYRPFRDQRTLFLKFAKITPRYEPIRAFAVEFGMLGGRLSLPYEMIRERGFAAIPGRTRGGQAPVVERAERIADWQSEIEVMRGAIEKWRASCPDTFFEKGAQPNPPSGIAGPLGNVLSEVIRIINVKLARHYGGPRLRSGRESAATDLDFHPSSLIAVLWLQFAMAISESQRFHICEVCRSEWVAWKPRAGRYEVTCSGKCRTRSWRKG
jgi:hypothetical protein